jgi:VWFA-related protein
VALWQNFTSSPAELRASLNRMRPVQSLGMVSWTPRGGGTLLYDAVFMTADNHLRTQSGRKTMVLITDGMDNGSRADLGLAVRAVQAMDTVVYSIYYGDKDSRGHGTSVLKKISNPTGGRMFRVTPETPLQLIFNVIREEMRSQYSLGYNPINAAKDGTFRKLEVKLRKKNLTVQARKGYYAFREGER